MLVSTIYNKNTQSFSYINQNDNGELLVHSINKDGQIISDIPNIKKLFYQLKYNKKCIKIGKYHNYDIYYNPKTTFKHFLKNGKEDHRLFLMINGQDANLYITNDQNPKQPSHQKPFLVTQIICGSCILAISLSGLTLFKSLDTLKPDNYPRESIFANVSPSNYAENMLNLISSSQYLSLEEKNYFANSDYLNYISYYLRDSYMSYELPNRLKDLRIQTYEAKDQNQYESTGYYDSLTSPNTLYIAKNADEELQKKIKAHEFCHLFQTSSEYKYILETVDELIASEFFYDDEKPFCYTSGVENLKLLLEIIGQAPVLNLSYGGDATEFETILRDNLSSKEYQTLTTSFKHNPTEEIDNNAEIIRILRSLYFNMNNESINNDPLIQYQAYYDNSDPRYLPKRYFFNVEKMNKTTKYVTIDLEDAPQSWYQYEHKKIIRKPVSYEEWRANYLDSSRLYIFQIPTGYHYVFDSISKQLQYIYLSTDTPEEDYTFKEVYTIDELEDFKIYEYKRYDLVSNNPIGWELSPFSPYININSKLTKSFVLNNKIYAYIPSYFSRRVAKSIENSNNQYPALPTFSLKPKER